MNRDDADHPLAVAVWLIAWCLLCVIGVVLVVPPMIVLLHWALGDVVSAYLGWWGLE